jgi:CHAT domain-containing protein/Tfp pilus assembly protein PilF
MRKNLRVVFMRSIVCTVAALLFLAPALRAQNPTSPSPPASSKGAGKTTKLKPHKPIERELHGGETQSYKIHVKAGQFIHVVVLQEGIDVTVTLLDPSGKEIAKMDSLNEAYGPEPVSAIAEVPGDFRLNVSAGDSQPGRYEIQLTDLRAPGEADRTRIKAERTYMEGIDLWSKGDEQSVRGAIEKWLSASDLWQNLNDKYEQALSLFSSAAASSNLGNRKKALELYSQALPLWRAAGDSNGEARTLNNIGFVYAGVGERQKALDYYAQSLPLFRATGDRRGEARTLNNIGRVYDELGEGQKALDYFALALPLRRAVRDRDGEARTLDNIGLVYLKLGENEKALDYFNQALPLLRAVGDRGMEAITLGNIGGVYSELGEKQEALDYYAQALPVFRTIGDRDGEATDLNNIAVAYAQLGENQKALDYYAQALPLRRAVGDRAGEAVTLVNIGAAYELLGDRQKAMDYFTQALPLSRAVGDRDDEALALNNIGSVYDYLGERQKALENYYQALSLFRAVGDPVEEADVLVNLMNHWRTVGKPSLAIFFGKQGIDRFQQVRHNTQGLPKAEQQSFLKSNEDHYRTLADLLIGEGRLAEAQEVLDLLKLEEYSDYSHHRGSSDSATKPVAFTRSEETAKEAGDPIQAEITAVGEKWSELKRKSSRTAEEQEQYDLLSEQLSAANRRLQDYFDKLYEDFGKGDPANKSLETAKAESSALQNLLREMKPGTVGLYTLVLDQKCVILIVTPAVMVARDMPITKAALRAKVFDFVGALAAHRSEQVLLPKAQDLYKILFTPIENDLAGAHATTLVWSLDDVLRYLPLSALHDGKQYVVERYCNVVFTTTSIGNLKDQPQVATWRGLAMGVSKDYEGLGELSAVPGELDAVVTSSTIKGSHGPVPGTIMLDDSFTEKNMEGALDQPPPLVHIATHFVFNPGDDERSYLLLGGKEEGGKAYHLSLADLSDEPRMNFAGVELLTLSGCETAMGSKDSDGREVDSLGIVGQRKGAKAVVATLWKVEDASVGILMETFYRLWTTKPGMTKSEALRQAQLTLLRGATGVDSGSTSSSTGKTAPYSNPYYWAPFILIGNWK